MWSKLQDINLSPRTNGNKVNRVLPCARHSSNLSTKAGKSAELVFFYLDRGGGGVRANVDRWIKQFEDLQEKSVKEEIVKEVKRLPMCEQPEHFLVVPLRSQDPQAWTFTARCYC